MIRFLLTHPRMLAFGVLMTLFSSFGQTFLISIFVPRILESFGLGTAVFGMLYAAATLVSAMTLPFFGRLIDRMPLRAFSLAAGGGLALACFAMGASWNVPMLFFSIVGLRLTGQGLLSLTASTTMARVLPAAAAQPVSAIRSDRAVSLSDFAGDGTRLACGNDGRGVRRLRGGPAAGLAGHRSGDRPLVGGEDFSLPAAARDARAWIARFRRGGELP